jgi:hypothetical protein
MGGIAEKIVLLADLSTSMSGFVGTTGKTRREKLEAAIVNLLVLYPALIVFAFGSDVVRVPDPRAGLPAAMGSTNLRLALARARAERPTLLLVVSDGEPDNAVDALAMASTLGCVIRTFYCGDEDNAQAIRFLEKLARCGRTGSVAETISLEKPQELAEKILRLTGPARGNSR